MAKGVFLHRADSRYDDRPEEHYQFPKQYYGRAQQSKGDWIVYYEPVKGGGRGYFAVARVEDIIVDPAAPDMYLALIAPGSYLRLEADVPFRGADGLVERGLLNDRGVLSGRAQAAIRPLSDEDFVRIVDLGLPDDVPLLPRIGDVDAYGVGAMREESFVLEPPEAVSRRRIARLMSRPYRDRVFRKIVLDAYDRRCAVTGTRLINGGGRAEVQAAHIRPVEHDGPDALSNGLALSGTAHWMFDRGLIGVADDLSILVSRQANDPDSVWRLANPTRRLIAPRDPALRPHPRFLAWHRENCFKN